MTGGDGMLRITLRVASETQSTMKNSIPSLRPPQRGCAVGTAAPGVSGPLLGTHSAPRWKFSPIRPLLITGHLSSLDSKVMPTNQIQCQIHGISNTFTLAD